VTRPSSLIARFREGSVALTNALADTGDGELEARETPRDWSVREIVHHLADTEVMRASRLFRLLAEDEPTAEGYDEVAFARRLHYERDVDASVATFLAVRESLAALLEHLSEEEWGRFGKHAELGTYDVSMAVERGVAHVAEHVDQIRRARLRWNTAV
jgi:hypothetical protein